MNQVNLNTQLTTFCNAVQVIGQLAPGHRVVVSKDTLTRRRWYHSLYKWFAKRLGYRTFCFSATQTKFTALQTQITQLASFITDLKPDQLDAYKQNLRLSLFATICARRGLDNLVYTYQQKLRTAVDNKKPKILTQIDTLRTLHQALVSLDGKIQPLHRTLLLRQLESGKEIAWRDLVNEVKSCPNDPSTRSAQDRDFLAKAKEFLLQRITSAHTHAWKHPRGITVQNGTVICSKKQLPEACEQVRKEFPELFYLAFDEELRIAMAGLIAFVLSGQKIALTTPCCFNINDFSPIIKKNTNLNASKQSNLLYILSTCFTKFRNATAKLQDAFGQFHADCLQRCHGYSLAEFNGNTCDTNNPTTNFLPNIKSIYLQYLKSQSASLRQIIDNLKQTDLFQHLEREGVLNKQADFLPSEKLKQLTNQEMKFLAFELQPEEIESLVQTSHCSKEEIASFFRFKLIELALMMGQQIHGDTTQKLAFKIQLPLYKKTQVAPEISNLGHATFHLKDQLNSLEIEAKYKVRLIVDHFGSFPCYSNSTTCAEIDVSSAVPSLYTSQILPTVDIRLSWDCPPSLINTL